MKFIDLFSGISGFRSGLERHGYESIAFCEKDKYARQAYKALYNTEGEDEYHDITSVTDEQWKKYRGICDLVVGGTPCQSFSNEGTKQGFNDTRGTLFFNYVNVVKQIQPKYFIFENVKGILSNDKGNTIKTVLRAFQEVGYEIDIKQFNSKYFGIPQSRERVFIIGKRKDLVTGKEFTKIEDNLEGTKTINKVRRWTIENLRLIDIVPNNELAVDTKLSDFLEKNTSSEYYDNIERQRSILILEEFSTDEALAIKEGTKKGYAMASIGDSVNIQFPTSKNRRGRVGKQIAYTLQTSPINQAVVECINGKLDLRRFTELEAWRIQGFTDEQFYKVKNVGVSSTQLYKQAGNSVVVNVIDYIANYLEDE